MVKTVFPWVASRVNRLYLAVYTRNRAAVSLHAAHTAGVREFWPDWLPTETPFLHDPKTSWGPRFDRPADPSLASEVDSAEHRATAREAAEQGCVLLVNNDRTLPIDAKATRTVAVVGPFGGGSLAATAMLGGYTPGTPKGGVPSIQDAFAARGFNTTYHAGAGLGSRFCGKNGVSVAISQANVPYFNGAYITTVLQCVYTLLLLQFCGSSGPTGTHGNARCGRRRRGGRARGPPRGCRARGGPWTPLALLCI